MKARAVVLFIALSAQRTLAASLQITSPAQGGAVSGLTRLEATVDPGDMESRIDEVTFTVDGDLACRVKTSPFICEWDAGATIKPHHIRAVATLRGGGRLVANASTGEIDLTLGVALELVQVTATVTDARGRLVRGLKPEEFRVLEDGAPQQISHFIGEDSPREIVVAVDMSGSMIKAMPRVRRAVQGFLSALRRDDHLTLLAFNDGIFTLARRETDAFARARSVDRLSGWGGTALYDVILKSLDLLDQRKGRKALVVFSDGEDTASRSTIVEIERHAERSDAPIYMIGQGRGTTEAGLKRILDQLARVTGGRAFYTDDPDDLKGVFATIVDELSSQYVLAYPAANPGADGAWHSIQVTAGQAHTVRARKGYRAGPR